MQPLDPEVGNSWPASMMITIENSAYSLLELLWLREAWQLGPSGEDVPPLLENPPTTLSGVSGEAGAGQVSVDQIKAWEDVWPSLWRACLDHVAQGSDPRLFEKLQATKDGSVERAELLSKLSGPSWREAFGPDAFAESYGEWSQAWYESLGRKNAVPLEETPERRALSALVPAWEAGLEMVVTIPCKGDFTRVLGRSALLVTANTREDPTRYAAALELFRKASGA
ncbi:hypothetical protein [Cryobacterium soli]|jgi:hypothetical protein|uniref:hypothetical protein n=1 Tax=Cryobacterium soli TaxID=2220095 RepID=UPI000E7380FC|nr:hypothetical protein [Cryobacterium soli]